MKYNLSCYLLVLLFFKSLISFSGNEETIDGIYSLDVVEVSSSSEILAKYYVNDNNTAGDVYTLSGGLDFIGCGLTPLNPCRTVGYLLVNNVLSSSDTLFVDAGIYEEAIVVTSDVMVIQGAGNTLTEFNGSSLGSSAIAFEINQPGVVLNDLEISNYTNSTSSGSAIVVSNSGVDLSLNNVNFFSNSASEGGAISFEGDTLSVSESEFVSNTATINSAGAILMNGQVLMINSSNFELNNANKEGGAIDLTNICKTFIVDNSIFTENGAGTSGGALQVGALFTSINSSEISGCTANGDGGGIRVEINKRLLITNSSINDNHSNDDGGGIYTSSGVDLIIKEGSVIGGVGAGNKAFKRGGGVYFGGDTLLIDSSFISYNQEVSNPIVFQGGGIFQQGGKVIITNESSVNSNVITGLGGGVFVSAGDLIVSGDAFIYENQAQKGGGIYFNADSIQIIQSTIQENVSTHTADAGGGMYVQKGTVIISQSDILSNTASNGLGGGMYVSNFSILELYGDSIAFNDASLGGGVYFEAVEMKSVNVSFSMNTSSDDGGAVYFEGDKLSIAHSRFRNNESIGGEAGALYVNVSDSAYLFKNSIINNEAINAGAMSFNGNVITVDSNFFQGNRVNASSNGHGGGAFRSYASELSMYHSIFNANSVLGNAGADGGVMRVGNNSKFFQCIFMNNTAPDDGSVVLVGGVDSIYFENCLFNNNVSGDDGVIKTIGSGKVGLHFVTIANNVSNNGSAGGLVSETSSRMTVKNSILYGNGVSDAIQNTATINVFNSVVGTGSFNDIVGNNNNNPQFVSFGNYHLQGSSSALGIADVSINPGVDIEDQPRTTVVDAGAFEFLGCDELLVTKSTDNQSGSGGECGDLRYAMIYANINPGPDTIKFDLATMGGYRIQPLATLPIITGLNANGTVIWGDVGNDNTKDIELDGILLTAPNSNGLSIEADSVTIKGLVINRFNTNGIKLDGGSYGKIIGNRIGTTFDGVGDAGNGSNGILLTNGSSRNYIGDGSQYGGNLLSGNAAEIRIESNSNHNFVYGNRIGTNIAGTAFLGGSRANIGNAFSATSSDSTIIGDVMQYHANIIGGLQFTFFIVGCDHWVVRGNYVGTDIAETANLGVAGGGQGFALSGVKGWLIESNKIAHHEGAGIRYPSATSFDNVVHYNEFWDNGTYGAMWFQDIAAQKGVKPPEITDVYIEGSDTVVSGTSVNGALIQLYFDDVDEGEYYYDTTIAKLDGTWSKVISLSTLPVGVDSLRVLQDSSMNTSNFSKAKRIEITCDTTNATSGTMTWTGSVNNDWFDCGNWDSYKLPNTKVLVIVPNTAIKPKITAEKAYCKSIQIDVDNGANLIIDADSGGELQIGD